MKKGICLLLIMLELICLVACGSDRDEKLEQNTKKFINSVKVYDFDSMQDQVIASKDFIEFKEDIRHFMKRQFVKRTSNDDEIKKDKELDEHISNFYKEMSEVMEKSDARKVENKLFSYLQICAAKIDYDIEEVDTSNMTVKVDFKFIDTKKTIEKFTDTCINILYEDGNADYAKTAKRIQKTTDKLLTEAYNEVRDERGSAYKYTEKEVYIKFDKSKYKVSEVDDNLKQVICFNTIDNVGTSINKNEEEIIKSYKNTRKNIEDELKN